MPTLLHMLNHTSLHFVSVPVSSFNFICFVVFFFFQAEDGIRDGRVTGVQTCALPIWERNQFRVLWTADAPSSRQLFLRMTARVGIFYSFAVSSDGRSFRPVGFEQNGEDRKSTRLNSSHPSISYAVFCLKKKRV